MTTDKWRTMPPGAQVLEATTVRQKYSEKDSLEIHGLSFDLTQKEVEVITL